MHFSVLVLSDECDESDELLVTVISIQYCVCTRLKTKLLCGNRVILLLLVSLSSKLI